MIELTFVVMGSNVYTVFIWSAFFPQTLVEFHCAQPVVTTQTDN